MEEENVKPKRRVEKKKIDKRKLIVIVLILVVFFSTFLLIFLHNKKSKAESSEGPQVINMGKHGEYEKYPKQLLGSWSSDESTLYRFDEDGTGYLRTSVKDYIFTYSIVGNKLYINFVDESLSDSDYKMYIKDKTLKLTGINATSGEYTFNKQ